MQIDESISKIKAVLTTNEMIVKHKVILSETERPIVKICLYTRNFVDSPADIVRAIRKCRELVPRPYAVGFNIKFVL